MNQIDENRTNLMKEKQGLIFILSEIERTVQRHEPVSTYLNQMIDYAPRRIDVIDQHLAYLAKCDKNNVT